MWGLHPLPGTPPSKGFDLRSPRSVWPGAGFFLTCLDRQAWFFDHNEPVNNLLIRVSFDDISLFDCTLLHPAATKTATQTGHLMSPCSISH
jgi:hypothetical protein